MTDELWRRVEDEMPPLGERVLCAFPFAAIAISYCFKFTDSVIWMGGHGDRSRFQPTHWMPLPDAPEPVETIE